MALRGIWNNFIINWCIWVGLWAARQLLKTDIDVRQQRMYFGYRPFFIHGTRTRTPFAQALHIRNLFVPKSFYQIPFSTTHLLHQKAFTPEPSYTKHLLDLSQEAFYCKTFSHQEPPCNTHGLLWRQNFFSPETIGRTPSTSCARSLFRQLLSTKLSRPQAFYDAGNPLHRHHFHPKLFAPAGFFTRNLFTATTSCTEKASGDTTFALLSWPQDYCTSRTFVSCSLHVWNRFQGQRVGRLSARQVIQKAQLTLICVCIYNI